MYIWLAWEACLKRTEVQLKLLADNMLMMVEKELEVEYVMQYIGVQKQIISTWKIMIKLLNLHISCI